MLLLPLQIHTQTQSHIYIHTYNLNKICLFKTAFTRTFNSFLNLLYQLLLTGKRGQARNIDHTFVLISTRFPVHSVPIFVQRASVHKSSKVQICAAIFIKFLCYLLYQSDSNTKPQKAIIRVCATNLTTNQSSPLF